MEGRVSLLYSLFDTMHYRREMSCAQFRAHGERFLYRQKCFGVRSRYRVATHCISRRSQCTNRFILWISSYGAPQEYIPWHKGALSMFSFSSFVCLPTRTYWTSYRKADAVRRYSERFERPLASSWPRLLWVIHKKITSFISAGLPRNRRITAEVCAYFTSLVSASFTSRVGEANISSASFPSNFHDASNITSALICSFA